MSPFSLINFMHLFYFRFCLHCCGLYHKLRLQKFGNGMLHCVAFYVGIFITKISDCLCVNLRTLQRIRKQSNESNDDYEGTPAQNPHSDRSNEDRIPEFFGVIQSMIDNDSRKSNRFIVRDINVFEFLIRQVVREDIQQFSFKIRKGKFLSQTMKDKKKSSCKAFQETEASPPTEHVLVFLR